MNLAGIDAGLGGYEPAIRERLQELEDARFAERLWRKDPTLWKMESDQQAIFSNAMGWLESPSKIQTEIRKISELADELQRNGFRHVLHMGMGGSSLAPLVFRQTFGRNAQGLPVTVLDTTDPATVLALERKLSVPYTFFIEASKSGTTAESRSFGEYFYEKVKGAKARSAGENFAVITDPGSMLEALATERGYKRTFLNYPDIGGRYSALSYFGLVPAALMGMDVPELLRRALRMVQDCRPEVVPSLNPGVALGTVMGELAASGRNKLTFLIPGAFSSFGMWLEQLIAESTGKGGAGIIPVAGEPVGGPETYGGDRLFVEFRVQNDPDTALEAKADALRSAGLPILTIRMRDLLDLGAQFFLWEIATATAGAILKINPFDQPNVESTKQFTRAILEDVRREGRVPEATMDMVLGPLRLYTAGGATTVPQALSFFFGQARDADYFAQLAYLTENESTTRGMRDICLLVRDRLHMAGTVGYGPRYLHSTGQLHKGGPNTGLFLLLTTDPAEEVGIPGQPYTFGMLMRAQALGDFEALRKSRRRVLRVHIAGEVSQGLAVLRETIDAVLSEK